MSKSRHYRWNRPKNEMILFPNLIENKWNASEPMEVIVSDMTNILFKKIRYETTFFFDTFNNKIISYHASSKTGDIQTYLKGIEDIKALKKETLQTKTILHTDQDSVYASLVFYKDLLHHNIFHSMSRAGTPTDNPINESLNGWIKEEMKLDFE